MAAAAIRKAHHQRLLRFAVQVIPGSTDVESLIASLELRQIFLLVWNQSWPTRLLGLKAVISREAPLGIRHPAGKPNFQPLRLGAVERSVSSSDIVLPTPASSIAVRRHIPAVPLKLKKTLLRARPEMFQNEMAVQQDGFDFSQER